MRLCCLLEPWFPKDLVTWKFSFLNLSDAHLWLSQGFGKQLTTLLKFLNQMQMTCQLFPLVTAEYLFLSVWCLPLCSATSAVSVLNSVTLLRRGILVSSGAPHGFVLFTRPKTHLSVFSPSLGFLGLGVGGVPNPAVIDTGPRSSIPRRKKIGARCPSVCNFSRAVVWFLKF